MLGMVSPVVAQEAQTVESISKLVKANKDNPKAIKDQIKAFEKANKKNADALAGLGRAYLDVKDTANARIYAEKAIKANSKDASGYLLQGAIAEFGNDGGTAAMWYEQAINVDPKDPNAYIKYARVYQKVDAAGAEEKLRALRTIDPSYPVDAEIAHMYYANNKLKKAFENYQKVDKSQLDDSKLLEYAMAALLLGESKASVEVSEYGVQQKPRSAGFNRITFYNYTDLKEYDKALKYADALFNNCDSAKFTARDYLYLGHANKGAGYVEAAISAFDKAYELDNTKTDVLKLISDTYLDGKNYDKAVEYYEKYIQNVDKKKVRDYTSLADIYLTMAEDPARKTEGLQKADKVYADLGAAFPDNKEYVAYHRAVIHYHMNPDLKQGASKPYYEEYATLVEAKTEKSAAETRTLAEAYNYLVFYYFNNNKIQEAKEYAKKLQGIQPDNETAAKILSIP